MRKLSFVPRCFVRRQCVLFILLLSSIGLLAQKNFQPGFIVLNSSDTIQGLIDYQGWNYNPKKIHFKKDLNAKASLFTVHELAYFSVSGKDAYKKVVTTIDMAPVDIARLEPAGFRQDIKDTVFLRELVKGERLTLYELIDHKAHFFLQEHEGQPRELHYRVFLSEKSQGDIYRLYTFRDQLNAFAAEAEVFKLIENSSYKQRDLIKVVQAIDKTAAFAQPSYNSSQKKLSSRIFVGSSLLYSGLQHVGFYGESESMGDASIHPGLSAGINLFSTRDLGRFIFTILLQYTQFDWNAQYERSAPMSMDTQKENISFAFSMNTFSVAPIINYAFYNTSDSKFYAGLGMQFNYSVYPENEYLVDNITTGSKRTRNKYEFENIWLCFPGRVGVNLKKFDISLTKTLTGGFSSVKSFKGTYGSQALTVAYQF